MPIPKYHLADGKCQMDIGAWPIQMANATWTMPSANPKWSMLKGQMANGKWPMANGKWQM